VICDANEETEKPVPIFGKEDATPAVTKYKTLMKMKALKRHLPKQTTLLTYLQKQCLLCVCGDIVMKLYFCAENTSFFP
jgi:hypothetical protein